MRSKCSTLASKELLNCFGQTSTFLLNGKHRHFYLDITEQTWRAHIEVTYDTTAPSSAVSISDTLKIGTHTSSITKFKDLNPSTNEELDTTHSLLSAEKLVNHSNQRKFQKEIREPTRHELREHQVQITQKQVLNIIKYLRSDGAPGPNGLPNALFRNDPAFLSSYLAPLFTHSLETSIIPDSWRGSILQPIYKSGTRSDPNN